MLFSWNFDEGTAMRSVVSKTEVLPDPLHIRLQVFREHVRLGELPVARVPTTGHDGL